jgi:AbrB family looped-hinge helix DNA binding protein
MDLAYSIPDRNGGPMLYDQHMLKVRVLPNGRITIPKILRQRLQLEPGSKADIRVRGETIVVTSLTAKGRKPSES